MTRVACAALLAVLTAGGCQLLSRLPHPRQIPAGPPTYSEFHQPDWVWERVDRVLVLPVLNESPHTRAGREVQSALTAELQQLARFEVVAGPADDQALFSKIVHRGGRFDEAVMLEIGNATRADVVLHATVTHYSPYPRPRLGVILQAVAPREGRVVATVDGLWDTTDQRIAERVRTYYRQRPKPRLPFIRNHVIASDDAFAAELALDSPMLFQRFVLHEASLALLGLPVPGVAAPGSGATDGEGCNP